MEEIRLRARDITTATAQQARATATTATEVQEVAGRLAHLTRLQGAQSESLARLRGALGGAKDNPEVAAASPREQRA
ncbi:hypothetical protein QEG98_38955 [Myxococcus sp. MxC21-1]|uniref:hypothetical protein n=1 Tax=Myxococcus sp. MxC21-1 TaxID=3041439 RepID=UPI00292CAC25|nr:hypothetical protein [Myxococcus sp. MxC21-1]WNZ61767.1 hypothetical protein QEG98_38955 [Myxococcus sp. MxC21-1]